MKLKNTNTLTCLFCALVCLLMMGICPGQGWCSDSDSQAGLGHAIGQECCGHIPVSRECFLSIECVAMEHLDQECWQHCSGSPFHFGCAGGLTLPNHSRSIASTTFAWIRAVTNDAVLAKKESSPQSLGLADAVILLLRTVILLT